VPIHVLAPDVAARIAAGEVIERPASVVKELVENALDAGAESVTVEVTGGGAEMIRVTDDGCGIPESELDLAFERHATSKLQDDEGLAAIQTLGFRGEALPSIAAVADVEIVSRTATQDAASYRRLSRGSRVEAGRRGAPGGTMIRADDIFRQLPARRAFLRTRGAETAAVSAVVSRYALAFPGVRFRLVTDGRQAFQTPGSGHLRDAVAAVHGLEVAAAMLNVEPAEGAIRVSGLAGPPAVARASRSYMSLFVNRRWIQNRRLVFAVEDAYRGMLMPGRHPVVILNIDLPAPEVDVNVHPTKAEVRFRDEGAVFAAVQRAVRAAIVEHAPVPAGVGALSAAEPALILSSPPWSPPLWEAGIRRAVDQSSSPLSAAPSPALTPSAALPVLRVIGQFGNIYIIAEGPDGMYLIDQHAAHERVLYERFTADRLKPSPQMQALLDPLILEPPAAHRTLVAEETEALAEHGFEIETFGDASIVLRALPQALANGDVRANVARFFDHMLEEERADGRDRVAMSLACHSAIRAGKSLALDEMRELIRSLEATEAPNTCPHGRPTMVRMGVDILARGFGRR
jgi:DNA mismatch repair protein MutL